ncbi:MAG: acyl-homoserine-lactone synthase [Terricaulis sp.]
MIHIVTAENRHLYHHALMQMHQQRKRLFIDELKWPLAETAGIEIDDFDSPEVVYLLETESPRGGVTGSARLLPTDRPHLLGSAFSHLCTRAPPTGANVWEATRFCPAPDIGKGEERRQLLARMIAAIMETALLFGVDKVTFVANSALAPLALKAGWQVEPLGKAHRAGRDRVTAFVAHIDGEGLREVRLRNAIAKPLTRFLDDVAKAA